jgi:hypothetical protein
MTDRDHFAAAALTGFASQPRFNCGSVLTLTAKQCYELADAMLRERAKTNHDAAPAARASVESVAPQPTTHGESDRTDKAAPRPSEGTGDTPDSPKPIKGGVSDRSKPINGPDPDSRVWETPVHTPAPHATPGEGSVPREGTQEPVAWGVANGKGLLATSISRIDAVDMQSYYACDTAVVPLYRQAPDFAPPPPDNAAKAPDNAEPVAWAVCTPSDGHWSPCYFHEPHAQRCANAIVGEKNVVPLYRHPPCQDSSQKNLTLTDAEREAVKRAVDSIASTMPYESQQGLADWKTLRGLLERLGGVE